jgi:hypothetical protein
VKPCARFLSAIAIKSRPTAPSVSVPAAVVGVEVSWGDAPAGEALAEGAVVFSGTLRNMHACAARVKVASNGAPKILRALTARRSWWILRNVTQQNRRKRVDPWVGPWLRVCRERGRELELADIASALGRSKAAISRIETGKAAIDADDLPTVLAAYGLTPARYAAEARRVSEA